MKYIFCIIALLIQPFFSWTVYRKQDKRQAALKMPMLYMSGMYLIIQIFVFVKFLMKFPNSMQYYAYLIQGGILAVFIIIELLMLFSNRYINDIEQKEQFSIQDFRQIQQELDVKRVLIKDASKQTALNKVYDKMRYADPVSSPSVDAENRMLLELTQQLSDTMEQQEFETQCQKILDLLEARKIKAVNGKVKG